MHIITHYISVPPRIYIMTMRACDWSIYIWSRCPLQSSSQLVSLYSWFVFPEKERDRSRERCQGRIIRKQQLWKRSSSSYVLLQSQVRYAISVHVIITIYIWFGILINLRIKWAILTYIYIHWLLPIFLLQKSFLLNWNFEKTGLKTQSLNDHASSSYDGLLHASISILCTISYPISVSKPAVNSPPIHRQRYWATHYWFKNLCSSSYESIVVEFSAAVRV